MKFIRKILPLERYRITTVTRLTQSLIKVEIENGLDSKLVFLFDGRRWKWYSTKHLVDDKTNLKLTKQYKKWLKKNGGKI